MQIQALALAALASASFIACGNSDKSETDNMRTLAVESITVQGVLVDTWCYPQDEVDQRAPWPPRVDTACSNQSMRLGYPVAVVVDNDSIWVLSESPRIFAKFLNDSVRVSGDIRSEGVLIPRTFERRVQDTWQTIF